MSSPKAERNFRLWTDDEDELLCQAVSKQAVTLPKEHWSWAKISSEIPGRPSNRCKERWCNVLDPHANREPWCEEEDALILQIHDQIGPKWTEIARLLDTGRPSDRLKGHANSLINARKNKKKTKSKDIRSFFAPKAPPKENASLLGEYRAKYSAAIVGGKFEQPDFVAATKKKPRTKSVKPQKGKKARGPPKEKSTKNTSKPQRFVRPSDAVLFVPKIVEEEGKETQAQLLIEWRRQSRLRRKGLWKHSGAWKPPQWSPEAGVAARDKALAEVDKKDGTAEAKGLSASTTIPINTSPLAVNPDSISEYKIEVGSPDVKPEATFQLDVGAENYDLDGSRANEIDMASEHLEGKPPPEGQATLMDTDEPAAHDASRKRKTATPSNGSEPTGSDDEPDARLRWRSNCRPQTLWNLIYNYMPETDAKAPAPSKKAPVIPDKGVVKGSTNSDDCLAKTAELETKVSITNNEGSPSSASAIKTPLHRPKHLQMTFQSLRFPAFLSPSDALLIRAQAAMHDLLSEGDCENIDVLRLGVKYYNYWRPKKGQCKVIILAESHGFTQKERAREELGLREDLLEKAYGGPRGFLALVYCLAYGEDEALSAECFDTEGKLLSKYCSGKGTPQFWTLLAACSRGMSQPAVRPNKQDKGAVKKNAFATDILKRGGLSLEQRLAAKLDILKDLQDRGIWLLDTSFFGWFIPQPQRYCRSKGTDEVHKVAKIRPPKCLKVPALLLAWEMYTKHVIREVAEEGGLKMLVPIGMEVEKALTRERLEEAIRPSVSTNDRPCVTETFPAPNAWIPGGYGPFYTTLANMVAEVAPPLPRDEGLEGSILPDVCHSNAGVLLPS